MYLCCEILLLFPAVWSKNIGLYSKRAFHLIWCNVYSRYIVFVVRTKSLTASHTTIVIY